MWNIKEKYAYYYYVTAKQVKNRANKSEDCNRNILQKLEKDPACLNKKT